MFTPEQQDRALGCILASAAGDALGAGYEFGTSLPDTAAVAMHASERKLGEWTDATAMAVPVLELVARGDSPLDRTAQGRMGQRWLQWALFAPDVANTVDAVFSAIGGGDPDDCEPHELAGELRRAAEEHYGSRMREGEMPRAARTGNGSLMRTHPLALSYLGDAQLATAARDISSLTHADMDSCDACVLWTVACRHAILMGTADIRVGLVHMDPDRRPLWAERITAYEGQHPRHVPYNSGCVGALQAAWAAITFERAAETQRQPAQRGHGLRHTLETAVRCGGDTDTVAAVAGALVGAERGADQVPREWRDVLYGWPGVKADALEKLTLRAASQTVAGDSGVSEIAVVASDSDMPPSYDEATS